MFLAVPESGGCAKSADGPPGWGGGGWFLVTDPVDTTPHDKTTTLNTQRHIPQETLWFAVSHLIHPDIFVFSGRDDSEEKLFDQEESGLDKCEHKV